METFRNIEFEIAALLASRGVKRVVMSPGSRNSALMQMIDNSPQLKTDIVVDERSAAFRALGICMVSNRPVALVCTSGTALLNYGPAVCEAYYRQLPLIVISADRQAEWIDRADSQTMRQPGVMAGYTVGGCTVDATSDSPGVLWMNNRLVNETLDKACGRPRGPVHINIHTTGVYRGTCEPNGRLRLISRVLPSSMLDAETAKMLAGRIAGAGRVLIVAGQMLPSSALRRALASFADMPNVAIVAENLANLHGLEAGPADLFEIAEGDNHIDILITIGGPVVSAHLKKVLRKARVDEHWSVNPSGWCLDTYQHLTMTVATDAVSFFNSLKGALRLSMPTARSNYSSASRQMMHDAFKRLEARMKTFGWCDLKAINTLCNTLIPSDWNLHVSNGTAVRYMELSNTARLHRVDCNRGVSGIDGSTSTAIGAAGAYNGVTLLITGDMSAMYDIGALFSHMPSRFKMVVIDNGGGAIFTNVATTRLLPSHDKFFTRPVNLPIEQIARSVGMRYFEADSFDKLDGCWSEFAAEAVRPCLMRLHGFDAQYSLACLRDIYNKQ